jgi:quercetin dioxygenase-like cupin family protein
MKTVFYTAGALALCATTFANAQTDSMFTIPDPSHLSIPLPEDIKCFGAVGKQTFCMLYGDAAKPGPYMIKYTWWPGNFTRPHLHNTERWAYVISGTYWVSSSSSWDESNTYPVRAGNMITIVANKLHWEGVRSSEKEPAILIMSGVGPVATTNLFQSEQAGPTPLQSMNNAPLTQPTETMLTSESKPLLNNAKTKCADLGFKTGTQKFGECVLKLSR